VHAVLSPDKNYWRLIYNFQQVTNRKSVIWMESMLTSGTTGMSQTHFTKWRVQ